MTREFKIWLQRRHTFKDGSASSRARLRARSMSHWRLDRYLVPSKIGPHFGVTCFKLTAWVSIESSEGQSLTSVTARLARSRQASYRTLRTELIDDVLSRFPENMYRVLTAIVGSKGS